MAFSIGFRPSTDEGRFLENIVFIELLRRQYEIYYHKQLKECDFLLRRNGKITNAIQVCYDMSQKETQQREIAGLIEALDSHDLTTGIIITHDEQAEIIDSSTGKDLTIKIIPIWRWLLETEVP